MYFVYILRSESTCRFYIGHTDHILRRFRQHAHSTNPSTCNRGPWILEYFEIYPMRAQAMARERQIKGKKSRSYILELLAQS